MIRVGELGENGNIYERGLIELNDKVKQSMAELGKCTAIAKESLETSTQSFTAARESQTESMRASRTVQQATQEALASLNGRVDKQESEIRSLRSIGIEGIGRRIDDVALQQRNVMDRVGKLAERGDIHEKGLMELNDKVKQTTSDLNSCTAIATKSLETSAQSFTATRELQTQSMKASRTVQQTTQEALASLRERIDRQDSEIRSLHSWGDRLTVKASWTGKG